uniref:Uncharacterized protein n=1 Tax=Pseudodiaptomus poplesia TaxID=213370 RepID=A0A0U2V6Z8_9MAXI|nr:hypothetical protein [Pseudodiaptomus poplesia]
MWFVGWPNHLFGLILLNLLTMCLIMPTTKSSPKFMVIKTTDSNKVRNSNQSKDYFNNYDRGPLLVSNPKDAARLDQAFKDTNY